MNKPGYIFVDDGFPEAADYDSNYVFYDPTSSESYALATEEAKKRLMCVTVADKRTFDSRF